MRRLEGGEAMRRRSVFYEPAWRRAVLAIRPVPDGTADAHGAIFVDGRDEPRSVFSLQPNKPLSSTDFRRGRGFLVVSRTRP